MNPEMAYCIPPCSLPQHRAFFPCKTRETRGGLGSQAFDVMRLFGDGRHAGGSETEFPPCSQGAAGNFRRSDLGGAAAALDAGVGAAVLVEELGELFEHHTT